MTPHFSPNYNDRHPGVPIDILLFHYTGMKTGKAALDRLRDPNAQVSAHYLVEENGEVFCLVPEEKRAWHAGKGSWRGQEDINSRSVGIEIVNPGHEWGYRPFPKVQMEAVKELARGILSRHPIPARNVIAHSDIAPDRKADPGELFDWRFLAQHGIGIWPEGAEDMASLLLMPGDESPEVKTLQKRLAAYGYGLDATGRYDEATACVITAFKRHFCPETLELPWDSLADTRLTTLSLLITDN